VDMPCSPCSVCLVMGNQGSFLVGSSVALLLTASVQLAPVALTAVLALACVACDRMEAEEDGKRRMTVYNCEASHCMQRCFHSSTATVFRLGEPIQ
jgi:hypothetical protein